MQDVSRRAVDIGDNIEDKYLFLSLNKICLDIPAISMKSTRIFTKIYIYQTMIRQRDGKEINKLLGELDLIGWSGWRTFHAVLRLSNAKAV